MSAAVHALRALLVSSEDEVRDHNLAYRFCTFATSNHNISDLSHLRSAWIMPSRGCSGWQPFLTAHYSGG